MPDAGWEVLAAGWVVTDGDRPLFGADPGRPGIVTPLLPDRRTAASLAAIVADGDEAWASRLGVAPLGDPWAAMRAFATQGVVGLSPQGRWSAGTPPRIRFAVRRREVGAPLPTVIATGDDASGWEAIVRPGDAVPGGSDLVAWVRHDITDRAAITFRDGMPLGQEAPGARLFEVRAAGRAIVVCNDPVAGPWGHLGGVVQLVSEATAAHDRCEALARSSGLGSGPYEVFPVPDLAVRLTELGHECPVATVTVNAHGHREHGAIAYGSPPAGAAPRWWDGRPSLVAPLLRGPGGIWTIHAGNRFGLVDEAPEWSGRDTYFWDGAGSGVPGNVPDGGVTLAWWLVEAGRTSVAVRSYADAPSAIAFLASLVMASPAPAGTAAREAVVDALAKAVAGGRALMPEEAAALARLVNLSGVGVFVEGLVVSE